MTGLSFTQVLEAMRETPGRMFARKGWGGAPSHIFMENNVIKTLYISRYDGKERSFEDTSRWVPREEDLVATDWWEVPPYRLMTFDEVLDGLQTPGKTFARKCWGWGKCICIIRGSLMRVRFTEGYPTKIGILKWEYKEGDIKADDWIEVHFDLHFGRLTFGEVLDQMKADPSKRFARRSWTDGNSYIRLTPGHTVGAADWHGDDPLSEAECKRGKVSIATHIDKMTASGERVIGWTPSLDELMAEDWREVKVEDWRNAREECFR